MDKKQFHIGDVLSVTTGRLVSPRHVYGLCDILDFMTGDVIYTHAIGRASKDCKPFLLAEHPSLAAITGDEVTRENWQEWLAKMVAEFGEHLEVSKIEDGGYTAIDPLAEMLSMNNNPIVAVTV